MNAKITGVILAGGRGQRMGGVDKGLQGFRGQPLVQYVIERLAPQVDQLLINANRNIARYGAFGYPVLPDEIPDFPGPLAGLHVGLTHSATPLVATAPCDSPWLPTDLVTRLFDALSDSAADLAVARTPGRVQPLFCLVRKSVLPHLTSYLATGGRKVMDWQAALNVCHVNFDAAAFININTGKELLCPS